MQLMLPSVLKGSFQGMDYHVVVCSAISFCGGWVLRDFIWTSPKSETPACTCNCHWKGNIGGEHTWSPSYSILVCLVILGVCLAFSQTALALKVSFSDGKTGEDRVLSLDVKGAGKSKGVFGNPKGLQIRGQ